MRQHFPDFFQTSDHQNCSDFENLIIFQFFTFNLTTVDLRACLFPILYGAVPVIITVRRGATITYPTTPVTIIRIFITVTSRTLTSETTKHVMTDTVRVTIMGIQSRALVKI